MPPEPRGNQDMSRTQGAQHPDTSGRGCAGSAGPSPYSPGTTADCTPAGRLIEGLSADSLLADRGYDSNALIDQATNQNMAPIIPPKKNPSRSKAL